MSLIHLALRLIPEGWRDSVARDLREESRRFGPEAPLGRLWILGELLRIAARFHMHRLGSRLPSIDGLVTGFLARDARAALRRIRQTPTTTGVIVLTLAAAVAAVVTVFSVLQHTVLSPLSFERADRLAAVWQIDPAAPDRWRNGSAANFVDWRRDSTVFAEFGAGQNISLTFTGFEDGDTPLMRRVTHGWFEMLRVEPVLGRTFTAEETREHGPAVAMLSHDIWQRRFGGAADVIGKTVELDRIPHQIVGVLPAGYDMPAFLLVDAPQVWLPLQLSESGGDRVTNNLLVVGRLRDGVRFEQAQAEFDRISETLARAHPDTNRRVRALVTPLAEILVRPVRTPVLLLFAAVIAVFLAACGNVSNVMLARALARRQEIAVQQALGAPRLRLVLQTVFECLALSTVAGLAAVWLALGAGRGIVFLAPTGFLAPRFAFAMDAVTLAMAAAAAIAAGLLASLPAVIAVSRRMDPAAVAAGSARAIGGRSQRRLASSLVAIEMLVAVVLLAGAGLIGLGFARLQAIDPGFDAGNALTFRVSTRGAAYADSAARARFYDRVLEEFRATPGVVAAGAVTNLPTFPQFGEIGAWPADGATPEPGREPRVSVVTVSPGLLEAMRIRLLAGRGFTDDDRADTPGVLVLSRSAARTLFGEANPIGRPVAMLAGPRTRTAEVIGVVADVRSAADPARPGAVMYTVWTQLPSPPSIGFVLRTAGAPGTVLDPARAAVRRVDAGMPLYLSRPLSDVLTQIDAAGRFASALLGAFAALGLLLVVTGVYGTLSYQVTRRRREIGVRMALGATRRSVLGIVLGDGLRPAFIGLTAGLIAAVAFGRLAASALAGTPAFSWPLFVLLPVLLLAIVAAASLLPAARATRVDPTIALRAE
jgi:putative ABC transport system permease protein